MSLIKGTQRSEGSEYVCQPATFMLWPTLQDYSFIPCNRIIILAQIDDTIQCFLYAERLTLIHAHCAPQKVIRKKCYRLYRKIVQNIHSLYP